jgi:hypothetical protein
MKHGISSTGNVQREIAVPCQAFRKNEDGSWTSLQVTSLGVPMGEVRIQPGTTFKKGSKPWGVDIVEMLEQNCG